MPAVNAYDNLIWVEKYRPKNLSDVVAHDDIIKVIFSLAETSCIPHLLFYGSPGTGKTSTALAIARHLYGDNMYQMTLELNASDDRSITNVRGEIKEFASTSTMFTGGVKMIILDECDAMTSAAQMALRRIIEMYSMNVRFCIICNNINRIIPALISRCMRFRFAPLTNPSIQKMISGIILAEDIKISKSGMEALIETSEGDMRNGINTLQTSAMSNPNNMITGSMIYDTKGLPTPDDIDKCINYMINSDIKDAYHYVANFKRDKMISLCDMISSITKRVIKIKFPCREKCDMLTNLAKIEYNLAKCTNDNLHLAALVGIFQLIRQNMGIT